MAAGGDFTLIPDEVIPQEPEYHNVVTPSESMKKEYLNLSATPVEKFIIKFKALPSASMTTLRNHYKDQSGGYYPFIWKTVPSYISTSTAMTGRWLTGSLSIGIVGDKYWACDVGFEKSTT